MMSDVDPVKVAAAAASSVVDNARKLGLTWQITPATVVSGFSPAATTVTLDADTEVISAVSTIGPVASGSRVYVVSVPPGGNFIVGNAFTGNPIAPMTIVYRSSVQSIASSAIGSPVQFETDEVNNFGMWTSTSNTDVVVPHDGVYDITGYVFFASGGTVGYRGGDIYINGGRYAGQRISTTGGYDLASIATSRLLGAGATINLYAIQTQGVNVDLRYASLTVALHR